MNTHTPNCEDTEVVGLIEASATHLKTLFWMGGTASRNLLPFFVLRWRGKSYPEVSATFKLCFEKLLLNEKWLVDVNDTNTGGITIVPLRRRQAEEKSSFDESIAALQELHNDKELVENAWSDLATIATWLSQFNDDV